MTPAVRRPTMQTTPPKPASTNVISFLFLPVVVTGIVGLVLFLTRPEGDSLGMTVLVMVLTLFGMSTVVWSFGKIKSALSGQNKGEKITPKPYRATVLYKGGYFARLVNEKSYTLAEDEIVHYIELRHQHEALQEHTCMTADRVSISLSPCAIWQITSPEAYVQRASQADKIMAQTVLAALTSAIGRRKFEQIAGNVDEVLMEAGGMARAALAYYGIMLHAIQVARIKLPEPSKKSEGQNEADFIDALNKSVPNASALTLQYALRLIELKLAREREAGAKKD